MTSGQDKKFWIVLSVFQLAFGLAVFFATRHYYEPKTASEPSVLQDQFSSITPSMLDSLTPTANVAQTPAEIVTQANEHFAAKQYDQAATLYEQLVNLDPRNVDAYNNLGITLHYLGRSTEALQWLDAGVEMDDSNQRIWLTLGFVNKDLGNTDRARTALTHAVEMGADSEVGESAQRFLDQL